MLQVRFVVSLSLATLLASLAAPGCKRERAQSEQVTAVGATGPLRPRAALLQTGTLPIDGIYHSMQGPYDRVVVAPDELDWVTEIRTEVVEKDTREQLGDEFFCHSQVQLVNGAHLLTMATGADEIRFPEGFAMPISSIVQSMPDGMQSLTFLGMVLNNFDTQIDKAARVVATVKYFRDEDFGNKPRPKKIYLASLIMEVSDVEEYKPGPNEPPISDDVTTHCALAPQPSGGKLALHWMVPPGVQKTRKRMKDFLPADGTVHSAWAHLHNYGVYMRLTDVTTGDVLFQADVENEPNREQIKKITSYSDEKGFRIYKDHEYEIEAVYNNTTDHDVDAMAMMSLYYNPDGNQSVKYYNTETGQQPE